MMKHLISLLFIIVFVGQIFSQNTEVKINNNSIGINAPNPTNYFHLEVPSTLSVDGIYSRINWYDTDDRRAIVGHSICNPGYGVGGHFTGGFRGIYARGDGGTYNSTSFPVYGVYSESVGSAGVRIGLFSQATGGTQNLAARFGAGDVEIQNALQINTTTKNARVNISSTGEFGGNATGLDIDATGSSSSSVYGTLVEATNTGTGNTIGHYAIVSANGNNNRAYAIYGNAPDPEDYALYGVGNSYISGDLRIGTLSDPYNSVYKVVVNGRILAEEIRVQNSSDWPDYVFADDYQLKPLKEVEKFIEQHKHLPNIPSAAEIEKDGIVIGEMQNKLMEKVEELTLYIIAQQSQIDTLVDELKKLKDDK